jgi:putative lipoprotein
MHLSTRRSATFMFLTLTGACSPAPAPDATPPAAEPPPVLGTADRTVYRCADGYAFTVIPHERGVSLMLPERTVELPPAPDLSGTRFEGEGIVFESRGDEARLETPSATRTGCVGQPADGPWEAARLRGVDYRAVGQEPGWTLEIEEGVEIRFETDYGETRATAPAPAPQVDGTRRTYRARTAAHEIVVQIDRTPCQDIMSGEPFPTTAAVWLDGREHLGCGRELRRPGN